MKHECSSEADLVPLAPVVTVLECPSRLSLDTYPLEELFAQKGELGAENTVCRVLEDISRRLDELQGPRQRAAFAELVSPAKRIGAIADQIGLKEISLAARHVATSAHQLDGIAMEATMTRLERAFDVAISQVWNFRVML